MIIITFKQISNTMLLYITAGYIRSILWEKADTEYRETVFCFYGDQYTVDQRSASATETNSNFIWTGANTGR